MSPFMAAVFYALTVVLGIVTNFCIAAYYAGKYKERVERLTAEVNRYEDKVDDQNKEIGKLDARLKEVLSAITGKVNGNTIREV